jgi:hypothetical protein
MYGYVRESDGVVQTMRTPYRFHTRGRKFKEVKMSGTLVWMMQPEPVRGKNTELWAVAKMSTLSQTMPEHGHAPAQPAKWQKGECKHIAKLKTES